MTGECDIHHVLGKEPGQHDLLNLLVPISVVWQKLVMD